MDTAAKNRSTSQGTTTATDTMALTNYCKEGILHRLNIEPTPLNSVEARKLSSMSAINRGGLLNILDNFADAFDRKIDSTLSALSGAGYVADVLNVDSDSAVITDTPRGSGDLSGTVHVGVDLL